jgi:hypothetical protein
LHVSIEGSDEAIEKALVALEMILFNPEEAVRLRTEQLKSLAAMNGPVGGSFGNPPSSSMGIMNTMGAPMGGFNGIMGGLGSGPPFGGSQGGNYGPPPGSGGGGDDYQLEIRIPNSMVGLVIGKGGEHIQKMQGTTGAQVQISKESDMRPGEAIADG